MRKIRANRIGVGAGLGELEAEIMRVVWKKGKATVKDVFEELYEDKRLAYTTIMTVMSRLAAKAILKQDRRTIPFVYAPAVGQEEMATSIVAQVVDKILGGAVEPLLSFLVRRGNVSEAELNRLRAEVKAAEKGRKD